MNFPIDDVWTASMETMQEIHKSKQETIVVWPNGFSIIVHPSTARALCGGYRLMPSQDHRKAIRILVSESFECFLKAVDFSCLQIAKNN